MTVVDRLDELQALSVSRRECSSTRQRTGARRMDVHVDTYMYSQPCPRATGCGHCPGTCHGLEVSQVSGVCAWSCCHLANGNKTCPRLFYVCGQAKFRKKQYDAWILWACRPKFTKPGTRVEQPSVLNKYFFQYSAVFGRKSRKFAGGV